MASQLITGAQIVAARERLPAQVRLTPVLPLARDFEEVGREGLMLKAEHLQVTGSYKARAAFHIIGSLDEPGRRHGIVLSSSGNFAQAVAYAGAVTGVPVTVVMPAYTAKTKIDATREYGATVAICDGFADREPMVNQISHDSGMFALHTFEDPQVLVGHGSIGLEILEQVPDVETILVPISSGGLAAGIATAVKATRAAVRVIGVQPRHANACYVSWQAGDVRSIDQWSSMADALSARRPGELPFRHLREHLDDIVLVSEDAIAEAVRLMLIRTKTIPEPAGAVAAAGYLSGSVADPGLTVSVVSGGNFDYAFMQEILYEFSDG